MLFGLVQTDTSGLENVLNLVVDAVQVLGEIAIINDKKSLAFAEQLRILGFNLEGPTGKLARA